MVWSHPEEARRAVSKGACRGKRHFQQPASGANLTLAPTSISVMPAKAGTQGRQHRARRTWTPACAGATSKRRRESSVWFVPRDDSKGVDAGGFWVPVYRKRIPGSAETIPDCGGENSRLARPRELARKHLIGKAVFEAFDSDIGRNPEYFPPNREFAVPAASGGRTGGWRVEPRTRPLAAVGKERRGHHIHPRRRRGAT